MTLSQEIDRLAERGDITPSLAACLRLALRDPAASIELQTPGGNHQIEPHTQLDEFLQDISGAFSLTIRRVVSALPAPDP